MKGSAPLSGIGRDLWRVRSGVLCALCRIGDRLGRLWGKLPFTDMLSGNSRVGLKIEPRRQELSKI